MISDEVGFILLDINTNSKLCWRTTSSEKKKWFRRINFNITMEEIDRLYYAKFTPSNRELNNGYDLIARINDGRRQYYIQIRAFADLNKIRGCAFLLAPKYCIDGEVLVSRDLGTFIKEINYPQGCDETLVKTLMNEDLDENEKNNERWNSNPVLNKDFIELILS